MRPPPPPGRRSAAGSAPSVDDLADVVARGGGELLTIEDPLEAEAWASSMLGTFYKLDLPLQARLDLEENLWPGVLRKAEATSHERGLAVLEAFAAVADEPVAASARAAAQRMRARGIPAPPWTAEIGSAAVEGVWVVTDVFGDHEAWYASFRYPGRPPHLVNALYDKALGGIIKDGFAGYGDGFPEAVLSAARLEPGVSVSQAPAASMARRVLDAIASGDLYLDNDWTQEFRQFRALLKARMLRLPVAPPVEPPEPPDDAAREALFAEFRAAGGAADEEAEAIVAHCLDYSCDYLGEDGLRWSPIVVEQFMLDYVPRKVSLNLAEVRRLPAVLRAWVRFALVKRGLEERWIAEAEGAVDQFAKQFRAATTDASTSGPAKSIANAMLAEGTDILDPAAVSRWIEDFNRRPIAERDALLGGLIDRDKD